MKVNDKEKGMWAFMADYYQKNKDENKFYECTMKELNNSFQNTESHYFLIIWILHYKNLFIFYLLI